MADPQTPAAKTGSSDVGAEHVQFWSSDVLVAEGRARGQGLPAFASPALLESHRAQLRETARRMVFGEITDKPPVSDHELKRLEDAVSQAHDHTVPHSKDAHHAALKELEFAVAALNALPEPPAKPSRGVFLAVTTALGIIFGLVASTTLMTLVAVLLQIDSTVDPTTPLVIGVIFGVFIGIVVGSPVVLLGEIAVGSNSLVIRHGPLFFGSLLAIGLAGFRFLHTVNDGNSSHIEVSVSGLAVALLFVEFAILIAIEFVNHVFIHGWTRHQEESKDHYRNSRNVAQEKAEYAHYKQQMDEAAAELTKAEDALAAANARQHRWERIHENRADYVDYVYNDLLRGFDQGVLERKQSIT